MDARIQNLSVLFASLSHTEFLYFKGPTLGQRKYSGNHLSPRWRAGESQRAASLSMFKRAQSIEKV